jgi:hypothetical protein
MAMSRAPVLSTDSAVICVLTGAFVRSYLLYAFLSTRRTTRWLASGIHMSRARAVSHVMSRAARDTAVYSDSDELSVTVRWREDTQCTGASFTASSTTVTEHRVSLSCAWSESELLSIRSRPSLDTAYASPSLRRSLRYRRMILIAPACRSVGWRRWLPSNPAM